MFFQADLQSGISKAVQESKLVACFVTDDGEESTLWEEDYLVDSSVKSSFVTQTILLRLMAGSQEAGFLAAIFPLPKTPTLVLIENGQLKEYIAAGVSREEFLRRLVVVFQSHGVAALSSSTPEATPFVPVSSSNIASPAVQPQSQNIPATAAAGVPATEQSSEAVQNLLSERKTRLEAHKKEQEAKEKVQRIADAKARKEALEADIPEGSQKSADMKYALMQKKRQQEMKDERARILKRVEDDKEERRQREAQRKALAKAQNDPEDARPVAASSSMGPPSARQSKECALQIRLFDGSTIRSRFPSSSSLRGAVRPWIDGQQTEDIPYTFKHVLTPFPNKNISISDEEQSLQAQGLAPSATLILVPVQGYTSAYESGGAGFVSRGVSAGYGVVSSGIGLVTGVLGSLLGGGRAQQPSAPETSPAPATPSSNINVRTLRDQDRPEDHQFYNGNNLNFEPRNDNDDKKDD